MRAPGDLERLRALEPGDVPYVTEAVRALVAELDERPLIGFAGGPFTLASYLVEGGPSKNHDKTKALMYGDPALWHALLGRLADITISFLQIQVAAGASAVQLFDSWVGAVSPDDYRHAILPHTSRIFAALASAGVPRIHFGVGTGELLGLMGEAGRRRGRGRLAYPARRGGPAGGAGQGAAGQPRSRRSCSRRGRSSRSGPGTCWPAAAPPRVTCSTSVTACCRKPTRTCWPGWPTWCTPSRFAPPRESRCLTPAARQLSGEAGSAVGLRRVSHRRPR